MQVGQKTDLQCSRNTQAARLLALLAEWRGVITVNRVWQVPLCLAASLLAAKSVHAQTLTASQILQQFNAVVFGGFSTSSDVEGRAVIGGALTNGQTFYLRPGSEAASTFAALSVYGSVTGGNIDIDNGGGVTVGGLNSATMSLNGGSSVYIGGANSGNISVSGGAATIGINGNNTATVTANGGGTVSINGQSGNVSGSGTTTLYLPSTSDKTGSINNATIIYGPVSLTDPLPNFTSTFQTPLTTLSTQLAGLTANSTTSTASGTVTFNATPNSSGQAIFAISSSVLTAGNENIVFDPNGATTIIVNVTCGGANCSITLPSSTDFLSDTSYAADTIWNFSNASTLNFGSEFGGTVLAPDAAVADSSPIDGDLIANSFSGSGELHNYPFIGNLSLAVPEPTSIALLSVGLVGLIAASRRKTRRRPTLQRHPGQDPAGADRLECLHPADRRRAGQALGQLVLMRGVARDQLQQEIAAAADHVALPHLGPAGDKLLERRQHHLLLAVQSDDGEEHDFPAEFLWLGVGVIATDHPGLLQPPHPPQAGWRGDAGAARQLDIGHPPIRLQLGQDAAVDRVEDRRLVRHRGLHARRVGLSVGGV